MKTARSIALALALVFIAACSNSSGNNDDDGGDNVLACGILCGDSGFTTGEEMDFGGGLIECQCLGGNGSILQEDCNAYCADFDVPPEDSLLSTTNVPNDKCVCDGTTPL